VLIALEYCFTRLASPAQADWIVRSLRERCAPFGTAVEARDQVIELRPDDGCQTP
jgi:hypothetical protein